MALLRINGTRQRRVSIPLVGINHVLAKAGKNAIGEKKQAIIPL